MQSITMDVYPILQYVPIVLGFLGGPVVMTITLVRQNGVGVLAGYLTLEGFGSVLLVSILGYLYTAIPMLILMFISIGILNEYNLVTPDVRWIMYCTITILCWPTIHFLTRRLK